VTTTSSKQRRVNNMALRAVRAEQARQRAARLEEARAIVMTGTCPQCGGGLRRNLALTGWWQCEQYGAVGFRKDDSKPSCSFQTFTE
jgi:hypothetical protein